MIHKQKTKCKFCNKTIDYTEKFKTICTKCEPVIKYAFILARVGIKSYGSYDTREQAEEARDEFLKMVGIFNKITQAEHYIIEVEE